MSAPPDTSSNPFEVLGVDRSASFEDVKLAYRRLARQHHPDANPDDPTALERFTALRRAYDRLKIFYQTLDHTGTTPPAPAVPPAKTRHDQAPVEPATPRGGDGQPAAHDNSRVSMPKSAVPATGQRRAFHRTGPMQQSGEITPQAPHPKAPAVSIARPPAPQAFGAGHTAMQAELVRGQGTILPGDDPRMFYALVGLRASDGIVFPRVPLNLCLVLDHSSSMLRGNKVDRLKESVHGIIDQLDEDDYLAIVTFGDRAEVLLPAQPLREKTMVHGAIDAMRCRGGTEISRGLAAGISELARNASRAISHLILLTDGQTYGDEMICLERAEEAVAMNVGITAYGLGVDWNNVLLDGIAGPTGGHSDYIESPEEMTRAFSARVHALQSTTLRKVTLAVRTADGHKLQRATLISPMLRPLTMSGEGDVHTCVIGDMSSNADYRLMLEFVLGTRRVGTAAVGALSLCYDVPGLHRHDETLTVPVTVDVTVDHDPRIPVDPRVTAALRHATVHRLQQQAWTELTSGNISKGTGFLRKAAEHLEAAGHKELAEVAAVEAARVENGEGASNAAIKRIIYGTRKLG